MKQLLYPFRMLKIRNYIFKDDIFILDVGCGNSSPSKTKSIFPNCRYHGIDIVDYNISLKDKKSIDKYYKIDLNNDDLTQVKNNIYDVIIFSHVIEHLKIGENVLVALLKKLKKGGIIYFETPRSKSTQFPSAVGTLNFFDDKTHVKVYPKDFIIHLLVNNDMILLQNGIKRDWRKIVIFPYYIPLQLLTIIRSKKIHAKGLWDIFGFSYFVIAKKK